MKHLNAAGFQRLIAYFLDFLIITTISDIILRFVGPLVPGYDPNLLISKYNLFMEQMSAGLEINFELVNQIMTLAITQLALTFVIMIPLVIGYFCILGHYWQKQTVGRALMGLRLVNNDEEESKVSLPRLFLREVIGNFILTYTLATSFFIPIVILAYLAISKRMVFADYIAKTKLIDLKMVIMKVENVDQLRKEFPNNDFMDAEFKDIKTYEVKEEAQPVTEESDEEYRIF